MAESKFHEGFHPGTRLCFEQPQQPLWPLVWCKQIAQWLCLAFILTAIYLVGLSASSSVFPVLLLTLSAGCCCSRPEVA